MINETKINSQITELGELSRQGYRTLWNVVENAEFW